MLTFIGKIGTNRQIGSYAQKFKGNSQIVVPIFSEIELGHKFYSLESGKFKCVEAGLWLVTWCVSIVNINQHHKGAAARLNFGGNTCFIYSGNPSLDRCIMPPGIGLNNMITICSSKEVLMKEEGSEIYIDLSICGDQEAELLFDPSSSFTVSKRFKVSK